MKRAALFLTAVTLSAIAVVPALAQSSTPAPMAIPTPRAEFMTPLEQLNPTLRTGENVLAGADTIQSMTQYSRIMLYSKCLAKIGRKGALQVLQAQPETRKEYMALDDIVTRGTSCARTGANSPLSMRRGSLAEALFKQDAKRDWAPWTAETLQSGYAAFVAAEKPFDATRSPGDQDVIAVTNCLAASQFKLAQDILYSTHGSEAEGVLMDTIFAEAPQCAGPKRPASLNRSFTRAFLAQSMYRMWLFRSAQGGAGA